MKKIFLSVAVCSIALGFSSCSETWDDNPVLKTHEGVKTANFLNYPAMQGQDNHAHERQRGGHIPPHMLAA